MTWSLTLADVLPIAQALVSVLIPTAALGIAAAGAVLHRLLGRASLAFSLSVISVGVLLLGYQRPAILIAAVMLAALWVYLAVQRGVASRWIVGALVLTYVVLHGLFGVLTFTPWLNWSGLTASDVLPTIGLTTAFTFLRLVHFAVDYAGASAVAHPRPKLDVFLTWCLFFPTFVHLPFIRYQEWASQLQSLAVLCPSDIGFAAKRVGTGIFKGALVGVIYTLFNPFSPLLSPSQHSAAQFVLAMSVAAVTYYIGFSGYTDIGTGIARLYGIVLPENFAPVWKLLQVKRMREFWRVWNITTMRWMHDYVYQPLGGNARRPVRNVVLTMTCCGLWHSVSVFGLIWGAGIGLLLALEHLWTRWRVRRDLPDLPVWARRGLIFLSLAAINLSLSPYAYDPVVAGALYPLRWLGAASQLVTVGL